MTEQQNVGPVGLLCEFLYTTILLWFYVLRAMFRCVVPPKPKDVSKEIVLITGAGHGIGREMALRFSRLGAVIVCVDINAKGNEETLLMIKEEKGKAFKYECNVTDRAAVMDLAEKLKTEVGDVTVLVNNAGLLTCNSLHKHTEQEIRNTMDVNVLGCFWTIQAFLPSMVKKNHGHLVTMSSMAGLFGNKKAALYCASKYAVKGIMDALAIDLYDNLENKIQLTTVYASIVNTGLVKKPYIRFPSILKILEPGEVADAVVDAMRRNYMEITVPYNLHNYIRYFLNMFPFAGKKLISDFLAVELAHDNSDEKI